LYRYPRNKIKVEQDKSRNKESVYHKNQGGVSKSKILYINISANKTMKEKHTQPLKHFNQKSAHFVNFLKNFQKVRDSSSVSSIVTIS
jgi:hypothetical protein